MQAQSLCYLNLCADNIDAGHHLGDRVFHLNSRIHLDKEPLERIRIHEELDRARVIVVRRARDSHGCVCEFLPDPVGQSDRRRHFDHLLVAPLDGAVALAEERDVAADHRSEIDQDRIDRTRGMDITVVTTAKTDDEGRALLKLLGFPFKEN